MEGEHLLIEAARAGLRLETLFVREGDEIVLQSSWAQTVEADEIVVLSRDVFGSVVETATPQGIAGTLRIPEVQPADAEEKGPVLLLEHVQDPGNVGTLIRSAVAFGAAEVLLVGECANAWSPKVLRASAGAVFHIPVCRLALTEAVQHAGRGRRIFAAVADGEGATSSMEATLHKPVLMIGNEGRGLTAEAIALADERVTIPCSMESLNAAVAGSLLLYEAFRQSQEKSR